VAGLNIELTNGGTIEAPTITLQSFNDITLSAFGNSYESAPFNTLESAVTSYVSGTLYLAGVSIPSGVTLGHLQYLVAGTAPATQTHLWLGLYDLNHNLLAVTADLGSTAPTTYSFNKVPIANIASGASTTFTTTYGGLYYVGFVIVAGTMPSLGTTNGFVNYGGAGHFFTGGTALTTPPTFPSTPATTSNSGPVMYLSVAP
jgi:hypothetical protein